MSVIKPNPTGSPLPPKEKIRQLIAQNRLEEAAELLEKATRQRPDLQNTVLVIRSRMRELRRNRAAGTLSADEEARLHAHHSASLLDVLDMLEADSSATLRQAAWKRRAILLLAILLGLLIAFWAWHRKQTAQEKQAYEQALQTGSLPACRAFLEAYPQSAYAAAVQAKSDSLQTAFNNHLKSAGAMHQAGLDEKAREFVRKALEINPDDSTAQRLQQAY